MGKMPPLQEIVEKCKQGLLDIQAKTNELVFNSGNLNYMTEYDRFIRKIYESAKENVLAEDIGRVYSLIQGGERTARKKEGEYISYKEAVELWGESDRTNGKRVLGKSGYKYRIKKAVDEKQIGVRKRHKRIISVNKNDLSNLLH